ncbi:MAG: type II secretion system major pseudopilin GspG [Phycisphaerales bacterium]
MARRAFTLAEIIVVIIIIGILATLVVPRLFGRIGQAKHATATSNANAIASAVRTYILDCGMPPPGSSLEILLACPSGVDKAAWDKGGPYLDNKEKIVDPWGKPFMLIVPGKKNVDFDIMSYGADGTPGGEGDNADIIKP